VALSQPESLSTAVQVASEVPCTRYSTPPTPASAEVDQVRVLVVPLVYRGSVARYGIEGGLPSQVVDSTSDHGVVWPKPSRARTRK
jgi:hypothetical protein